MNIGGVIEKQAAFNFLVRGAPCSEMSVKEIVTLFS
jgi:hypothetical protein